MKLPAPLENSPEHRQVWALAHLLGDDDPKITKAAWEELEKRGEEALPILRQSRQGSPDPRVREMVERFLTEWKRREVFRDWADFCRRPDHDLEIGSMLIAQSEDPYAEVIRCRSQLESYAELLRGRVGTARTLAEAVRIVSQFLFDEVGFSGNARAYYEPGNSYIHTVLATRKGIPITLAAVFLLVARRLSLRVDGVNMPYHFLLKYRDRSREVFFDPFSGGSILSTQECAEFLSQAGIQFEERHFEAVDDRTILRRMLGNLFRVYWSRGDQRRFTRVAAMLKLLQPSDVSLAVEGDLADRLDRLEPQ